MMDLGTGFNEMQWLVLVIFSSIISSNIFFKIGVRAGIEEAIEVFDMLIINDAYETTFSTWEY